MAGTLIVSNLTTDTDNTFIVRSNTGTTLFSANTTGIDVANSIGATAITNDKILSVANTKISGNIISSQITSVANTQLTGTLIASQIASVNATTATSGTLPTARLPAGSVLQVVSTTKTDTFSTATTGSWVDVTGMSVSITPTSSSSKVLVIVDLALALSTVTDIVQQRLVRGSTPICVGDSRGSKNPVSGAAGVISSNNTNANHTRGFNFLDSPSTTSSTTYKVQVFSNTGTKFVNRCGEDIDSSTFYTSTSTITVMEIAA